MSTSELDTWYESIKDYIPWNVAQVDEPVISDPELDELYEYFTEMEGKREKIEKAVKFVVNKKLQRIREMRKNEYARAENLRRNGIPFKERMLQERYLELCDEEEEKLTAFLEMPIAPLYRWLTLDYKKNWRFQVSWNLDAIFDFISIEYIRKRKRLLDDADRMLKLLQKPT